ncbi:unnamed protein product [Amaranthus hypochondriacus]
MENLALVSSKPVMGLSNFPDCRIISTKQCFGLPLLPKRTKGSVFVSKPRSKTVVFALFSSNSNKKVVQSTPETADKQTTSVGVNPLPYAAPPPSQFGSPLFWIGVGVACSALFSFASSWLKKFAMQQTFKTMMSQMGSQSQFSNAGYAPGSPFPYTPPSTSGSNPFGYPYQPPSTSGMSTSSMSTTTSASSQATYPSSAASKTSAVVDVSPTKTEASKPEVVKEETENKTETKRSAFVDVSPEETFQNTAFENYNDSSSPTPSENVKFAEVVQNGAASTESTSEQDQSTRKKGSLLSVDTLEKMMEDPSVQKMVFPHLPEEMRDPATFKWMLQNPVYRQQLQEMLDNMGGTPDFDNRMLENLKNFDINSPEVKQQFDQIGLTPEEVISKIMANPDIAMAFQNPRVQQAIMDVSQNPMNIVKYQNDKEVMDVFNKIQQLFPGTSGPF